ncbi:MAG: DUF1289 domain-containing protein [Halioglobus sp.]
MSQPEPKSPCIPVCALDENDICIGCFRSADEITDWFMASGEEKREILERAGARMQASNIVRLNQ